MNTLRGRLGSDALVASASSQKFPCAFCVDGGPRLTLRQPTEQVRPDWRVGFIASLVRYNDSTSEPAAQSESAGARAPGGLRSVAYEIFLSEMFVPYQLDDNQWSVRIRTSRCGRCLRIRPAVGCRCRRYYRTFLDAGEFGMGSDANTLGAAECGGGAEVDIHFFDLHDVTLDGAPVSQPRAVCGLETTLSTQDYPEHPE